MKRLRKWLIGIGIAAVVLIAASFILLSYTRSFSPKAEAKFGKDRLRIMVYYCQPSRKGRKIFGGLVPFGKVWRTGANEATEIELKQDVMFGDKIAPAGRYALFTIPKADGSWTIILNKTLGQWGAFSYNPSQDLLRIEARASMLNPMEEKFTIEFKDEGSTALMEMRWERTRVVVPISPAFYR